MLTQTAMALTKETERLDVPFQFNPVVSWLEAFDAESLRVRTGVQLHCLLASDDDPGKDGCHHPCLPDAGSAGAAASAPPHPVAAAPASDSAITTPNPNPDTAANPTQTLEGSRPQPRGRAAAAAAKEAALRPPGRAHHDDVVLLCCHSRGLLGFRPGLFLRGSSYDSAGEQGPRVELGGGRCQEPRGVPAQDLLRGGLRRGRGPLCQLCRRYGGAEGWGFLRSTCGTSFQLLCYL